MSNEKNEKQPQVHTNAPAQGKPAEAADDKDATIAALQAQIAALEASSSATKAPVGAKPVEPLTDKNAGEPITVRVKHGSYVGEGHPPEKPALPGTVMRLPRRTAYKYVQQYGTFEFAG